MARCRFVTPDSHRIQISDGEWIEIKKRLNVAEQRKIFGRLVKAMDVGKPIELNPEQIGRTKVLEYLLAWSLTDATGKSVRVSDGAIDTLDTETFGEILQAIESYEEAQDLEREKEKNAQGGESPSSETSLSAVS